MRIANRSPRGSWTGLAGLLILAALLAAGCGGAIPPDRTIEVPELILRQTRRAGVLRTYGQPKQKTAFELWYVGPVPGSLVHGAPGWMSLLAFDTRNRLKGQEQLRRRSEQSYVVVEYRLRGDLAGRKRDQDFDTLMKANCVELASANPEYLLTTQTEDLFVLARRLPSGNEAVARWTRGTIDDRGDVTMVVRGLPGRDEPLLAAIDGAIGKRMLLIEIVNDAEQFPPTDFTPGSGR